MLVHHRWYLPWSGDTVTLDGETFLDVQLAPHQAEASTLAKQSGIYYEEYEAMNNSAGTSNVVAFPAVPMCSKDLYPCLSIEWDLFSLGRVRASFSILVTRENVISFSP